MTAGSRVTQAVTGEDAKTQGGWRCWAIDGGRSRLGHKALLRGSAKVCVEQKQLGERTANKLLECIFVSAFPIFDSCVMMMLRGPCQCGPEPVPRWRTAVSTLDDGF